MNSTEYDTENVVRLYKAVVTQALIDATHDVPPINPVVKRKPGETDEKYESRSRKIMAGRFQAHSHAIGTRDSARRWLTRDRESFNTITEWAGYNSQDIRERSLNLEKAGWKRPSAMPEHALAA